MLIYSSCVSVMHTMNLASGCDSMHRNYGIAGRPFVESREKLVDRIYFVIFGILLFAMTAGMAGVTGAVIWWLFFR